MISLLLGSILSYLLLGLGIYFLLCTALGLIRFPDLYTRLHAGSKCLMAGTILVLLGCIFLKGISFASLKLLVILIFILITNSITIHIIASFAYDYNKIPSTYTKKVHDEGGEENL